MTRHIVSATKPDHGRTARDVWARFDSYDVAVAYGHVAGNYFAANARGYRRHRSRAWTASLRTPGATT